MKRGFTLVELLAVIVILSVIAIITVPIIGNVIEESKKKALEQSAYGLLEAADYLALSSDELEHFTFTENGVESITENKLDYKGKIDAVGDLYIDETGDISLCLYNDKYYVYKSYKMNDKVVIEEKKDNQTCIIGKDLLTNKYVAYAAEEGSSVNDSYYTKGDVDDLIERKVQEKVNEILSKFDDYATKEYVDEQAGVLNTKIGSETLATSSSTVAGAINEVNGKLSHIGMIVQSTTLDTEEKVKAIYGGTTWTKIEGKFLLGQSDTYEVNGIGGEETHTLTINEMPAHNHSGSNSFGGNAAVGTVSATIASGSDYWGVVGTIGSISIANRGGGSAHNNMPPYYTVYIWLRTA